MAYLGREATKAPLVTADLPDNAVTLAKMTGGTDGQIITYDASGDPVAVGPGTDGQVLTSTGAGSPPAFEAVSPGTQYVHAWICANGVNNGTNADYNMDALTDIGTGNYGLNFTSSIASDHYCAVGMGCIDDAVETVGYSLGIKTSSGAVDEKDVDGLEIMSKGQDDAPRDIVTINVAIIYSA